MCFPVGVPRRILRHIGELPVRGCVRSPVRTDVEQAGVGAVDEHDVLLRHREEAEVAGTFLDVAVRRFDDGAVAHRGHVAPWQAHRKETPVVEQIACHRIGDVVRRQRDEVDVEAHLTRRQIPVPVVDKLCLADGGTFDLERDRHPATLGAVRRGDRMRRTGRIRRGAPRASPDRTPSDPPRRCSRGRRGSLVRPGARVR